MEACFRLLVALILAFLDDSGLELSHCEAEYGTRDATFYFAWVVYLIQSRVHGERIVMRGLMPGP